MEATILPIIDTARNTTIIPEFGIEISKPKVLTEDLGKQFEMAICIASNIEYQGKYKYGLELPEKLAGRLSEKVLFLGPLNHTASGGSRYDYTSLDGQYKLSAKTIKKTGGKVAPQCIGQAMCAKFCTTLDLPQMDSIVLKQYIQENIQSLLPHFEKYTFDTDILFYNKQKDSISFIQKKEGIIIPWSEEKYTYSWTKPWNQWTNSTTLKVIVDGKATSIMEFQFHTIRKNMAIRWCFENVLYIFAEYFTIEKM